MGLTIKDGMVVNKETGEVLEIDSNILEKLCQEYAQYRVIRDSAKTQMEEIAGIIKNHMGNNTEIETSSHKITYKPVSKMTLDSTRLKKELPDVYEKYSMETVTRPFYVR